MNSFENVFILSFLRKQNEKIEEKEPRPFRQPGPRFSNASGGSARGGAGQPACELFQDCGQLGAALGGEAVGQRDKAERAHETKVGKGNGLQQPCAQQGAGGALVGKGDAPILRGHLQNDRDAVDLVQARKVAGMQVVGEALALEDIPAAAAPFAQQQRRGKAFFQPGKMAVRPAGPAQPQKAGLHKGAPGVALPVEIALDQRKIQGAVFQLFEQRRGIGRDQPDGQGGKAPGKRGQQAWHYPLADGKGGAEAQGRGLRMDRQFAKLPVHGGQTAREVVKTFALGREHQAAALARKQAKPVFRFQRF